MDGPSNARPSSDMDPWNVLTEVRLPADRADLHPVEGCWKQLETARGAATSSGTHLVEVTGVTIDRLNPHQVGNYF